MREITVQKLAILEDGQERIVELDIDEITIGRAVENIIQIDEKRSSRNHCSITRNEDGEYQIEDLETSNGTRVNGGRIVGMVKLKEGDEIEIGDLRIRFGDKPEADEFVETVVDPNAAQKSPVVVNRQGTKKKRRRKQSSTTNRHSDDIDMEEVGAQALDWVQKYAVVLFAATIALALLVGGTSAYLSSQEESALKRRFAKVIKTADDASSVDEMAEAVDKLKVFQRKVDEAGFSQQFGALTSKRIRSLEKQVKRLRDADNGLNQLKINRKTLEWLPSRYYVSLLGLRTIYADTPTAELIDAELNAVRQELREELQQRYMTTRSDVDKHLQRKQYQQAFRAIAGYAENLGHASLAKDAIVMDFSSKADNLRTSVREGMKKDYEAVVDSVKDSLLVKNYISARRSLTAALARFGDTPFAIAIKRDLVAIRLMASRKITTFAEARKISDGRQKYMERIDKAKALIAKRKYEQASELLEEVAQEAGGEIASELKQQVSDIRMFLSLRTRLISQINTGQLKSTAYNLSGTKMEIIKADEERVTLRIDDTGRTAQTWKQMSATDMWGFFMKMDLNPKDYETIGVFCFYHDLIPKGHGALIKAINKDRRSKTTETRVFDLFARLSGTTKPAMGFVIFDKRIMTRREKEMRIFEQRATKLAAEMTSGGKEKRDRAFKAFKGVLANAGTKFGATFAKNLKTKLITKLEKERKLLLARLKGDSGMGNITQLRSLKTELNRRRAFAKKLIFDTKAYPYDACHGCKAQPEVDKRVGAVKELWDNPFASGLVGGGVKAKSDRVAQINDQLKGLGVAADTGGLNLGYIAALANKKMNIQNFGLNGKEQKLVAYNHKVFDENKAMDTVATSSEKKQVFVTNEYRSMMGHHCVYIDDRLTKAARGHSAYMQSSGKFAHNIPGHPDGASPSQRTKKAGYPGGASENISMGRTGPKAVHDAWYNSSGHHRNLLMDRHRVMGAGQAGKYWTQNFGTVR